MTPKDFLSQAWKIDERIEQKIEERERLEARLTAGRMSNLSGMPRGGKYDWTDAEANVLQLTEKIKSEIAELCRIKRQVNDAIDAVADSRYRNVLEMRYRNYMQWETISEKTGYALRYLYRLHGEALECVKVPDN